MCVSLNMWQGYAVELFQLYVIGVKHSLVNLHVHSLACDHTLLHVLFCIMAVKEREGME